MPAPSGSTGHESGRLSLDYVSQSDNALPRRAHWSDNLAAQIRATPPWILFAWLAAPQWSTPTPASWCCLIVALCWSCGDGGILHNGRFPQTMFCRQRLPSPASHAACSGSRRRRRVGGIARRTSRTSGSGRRASLPMRGVNGSIRVITQLSKVQSVDQRMRFGTLCRLSPTADVPSQTSGAGYCQQATSQVCWGSKKAMKNCAGLHRGGT